MRNQSPPSRDLSWSTWWQAVGLILRGATWHPCGRVALIVGTLLTAVNQTAVFVGDWNHPVLWVRVVANYAIPYTVSSIGLLSAHRS